MRQSDDKKFADMLNRLRIGEVLQADIDQLNTRMIARLPNESKLAAIARTYTDVAAKTTGASPPLVLFTNLSSVDDFNALMMKVAKLTPIIIPCEDDVSKKGTRVSCVEQLM